jgi:hypothetical protein
LWRAGLGGDAEDDGSPCDGGCPCEKHRESGALGLHVRRSN